MAQLRHTGTSELLAEGSPLQMAVLADTFDPAEVVFDDVGEAFDPATVRGAVDDELAGLRGARTEADGPGADRLDALIAEREAELAAGVAMRDSALAALADVEARLQAL